MDLHDKYKTGSMQNYDTEHGKYRELEFWRYLMLREKEFINNFRFEGDEEFTRQKQRTMLKLCFRYGIAGVVNTEKLVRENMDEVVNEAFDTFGIDLTKQIGEVIGIKVPVGVSPNMFDGDGKFVRGIGTTTALNIQDKKVYSVNKDNTAVLFFDDDYRAGWWWWLTPAYTHASNKAIIKKKMALTDSKLVENNVNNSKTTRNFKSIYEIDKDFIDLSPSQDSIAGDGKSTKITVNTLLDNKLKKLDLSNGETVNDLLEFLVENEKVVLTEMGKRTNTNEGKNERSISQDFEAMEAHYKLKESEFEDYMNNFIDEYKRVFGKQLTLVVKTTEVIEDLRAKEVEKAGHGDNKGGNDGSETK